MLYNTYMILVGSILLFSSPVLGFQFTIDSKAQKKGLWVWSSQTKAGGNINCQELASLARDGIVIMDQAWVPALEAQREKDVKAAKAAKSVADKAKTEAKKAGNLNPPKTPTFTPLGKPQTRPSVVTALLEENGELTIVSSVKRGKKIQTWIDGLSEDEQANSALLGALKQCEQTEDKAAGTIGQMHEASCGEMMALHLWSRRNPGKKMDMLAGQIVTVELQGEDATIKPPCSHNPDTASKPKKTFGGKVDATYGCAEVIEILPGLKTCSPATKIPDKTGVHNFSRWTQQTIIGKQT